MGESELEGLVAQRRPESGEMGGRWSRSRDGEGGVRETRQGERVRVDSEPFRGGDLGKFSGPVT
jgi:hypothetical protein